MRALLVVVCLWACRPAPQAKPFILRVAVTGSLDKVEPQASSWTVVATALVFERLISFGHLGELVPVLATKVEMAGPRALRVWLRSDARFSDGSPVTFADILASTSGSQLRATDEGQSILFRSEDAAVPIELLLWQTFVSRRSGGRVLGTGAFAVVEEDSKHILLRRLHPARGFIEQVLLSSYATPQDAFARTLKGDADMLPEVQPRWIEFFEGVPRMKILRGHGNQAYMVVFNRRRLARDERVALASQLATDEVRLLAFGEDCLPKGRRPDIEPLPAGRPLEVLTIPYFDRFAASIRRALGPRGGEIRDTEPREIFAALRAGNFDLAIVRPTVWPPFTATLTWRTGGSNNTFGYSNPAVDAALDARDWKGAQRALDLDPPAAFVCTPPSVVVLDSRIKTPGLDAAGFMESLPQWEVSQ